MPVGVYERTAEHKAKISKNNARYWAGKKFSKEYRQKLSDAKKGKKLTPAHCKAISESHKGRYEEKSNTWKGDKVGYMGLHTWVRKHLGQPMLCSNCGFTSDNRRRINWANKSHKYKRDLSDWVRLCIPCHRAYDAGRLELSK